MDAVERVRRAVQDQGRVVNDVVLAELRELRARPALDGRLTHLSPEYGRAEQLLVVDESGSPAPVPHGLGVGESLRTGGQVGPAGWVQPIGQSGVLAARWLCHLVGLRHRTVELFLDHPDHPAYTLVQIRSVGKAHYPGCMDIPAAGHISGMERPDDALLAETSQELGLDERYLRLVRPIGSYESVDVSPEQELVDAEFRAVYAARLTAEGLLCARFTDGEVAALAVCEVGELEALMRVFPDRVASGLRDSWPLYLDHRQRQMR